MKVIPELLILAVIVVFASLSMAHCQTTFEIASPEAIPDAPQPQLEPDQWRLKPRTPFFAFGHPNDAKPLRTNREVFTSKTFFATQAALWGSALAELHYTKNSPTLRPRPKGGELAADMLVPILGSSGFYFIADKFTWRPIGILAISYVVAIQSHSAATGRYH